jgi:hypothetical protein
VSFLSFSLGSSDAPEVLWDGPKLGGGVVKTIIENEQTKMDVDNAGNSKSVAMAYALPVSSEVDNTLMAQERS